MTTISRVLEALPAAAAGVGRLVEAVPADGWEGPTPCGGWSVRDLVNHLTAEHLWAPRLLGGEGLADVGDAYDGDVLGEDPVSSWRRAVGPSLRAWAALEDETRPVETSAGSLAAGEYARQMLVDLVVHGWDLAAALGLPPDADPRAVREAAAYEEPRLHAGEGIPGLFGPAVPTTSTDPLERLVALLGRDPAWRP